MGKMTGYDVASIWKYIDALYSLAEKIGIDMDISLNPKENRLFSRSVEITRNNGWRECQGKNEIPGRVDIKESASSENSIYYHATGTPTDTFYQFDVDNFDHIAELFEEVKYKNISTERGRYDGEE